jgi:hypothetical protein
MHLIYRVLCGTNRPFPDASPSAWDRRAGRDRIGTGPAFLTPPGRALAGPGRRAMAMQVIPDSMWLDMLTALIAVSAPLAGAKLGLYKNNVVPTVGMTLADLTPADIVGVTPAAVTWGTVHTDPTDGPVVDGGASSFIVGTPVVSANTIYGAYLTDTGATKLLAALKFDVPVTLDTTGQGILVVPQFGPRSRWLMI